MTLREQVMAAVVGAPDDRLQKALSALNGTDAGATTTVVKVPVLVTRDQLREKISPAGRTFHATTIWRRGFPVYTYVGGQALYDLEACLAFAQTIRFRKPKTKRGVKAA